MTRPTYEELERQLAEAKARTNKYDDLFRTERDKLVAALGDNANLRQQIEDSMNQEPFAWFRTDVPNWMVTQSDTMRRGWELDRLPFEPLYASPIIPPTVEEAVKEEREAFDGLVEKINSWRRAYPLSIFPEPDFDKAHAVLQEHGMTLDAISASNMRHVLKGVGEIIDAAIRERGEK